MQERMQKKVVATMVLPSCFTGCPPKRPQSDVAWCCATPPAAGYWTTVVPRRFPMTPLTQLSLDEQLLQQSVRDLAEQRLRPLVRSMDEQAQFDAALVQEFFRM